MRRSARPLPLLVALLPGLACAPVADLRPPSSLVRGDRRFEAGAGFVRVSPRPYVDEPASEAGQVWFTTKGAEWLNLSAVSVFDHEAAGGGVAALARFVETDRFVAASSLEAGFAWAAFSLSGAARLFDDTWLYTAPRLSHWGPSLFTGVPVGVTSTVHDGLFLRAELQVSWVELAYYNRRVHLAGAGGYAW